MPVRPPGRAWLAGPPVLDGRFVSPSQRRFIMEPHREEPQKAPPAGAEQKPKRFRIVKLEERIAPSKGGNGTNNTCACGTGACISFTCAGCGSANCTQCCHGATYW
jgi:hypothetical protein